MTALRTLFSSKKFLTALVALLVSAGAKFGLQLDNELVMSIVGLFAIVIGAQGAADAGKETAKLAIERDKAFADSLQRKASGQDGFSRIWLMAILALLAAVWLTVGCGATTKRLGGVVIDCTTENSTTLTREFGPTVDALLRAATQPDGRMDWSQIRSAAKSFGLDTGACVLANAIAGITSQQTSGAAAMATSPQRTRAEFRALSLELFGGHTFRTTNGDL